MIEPRRFSGIAVLACTLLSSSPVLADTLVLLHPSDDALVASDATYVDQNFGSDPQILAWANYPVFGARSYLAFDVSNIPTGETVTFARLNLFQFLGGGYSSGVDLFRVADDAWDEATLTWNNQPVPVPEASDLIAQDLLLNGSERRWVSFDLLSSGAWNPAVDITPGDGRLSLILRITGGEVVTQRAHSFCSKDAGAFDCLLPGETGPTAGRAPQLVIGTPEPSRAALLAAGVALLTLAGNVQRRS